MTCLVQNSDDFLFWYRILTVTSLVQDFDSDLFGTRFQWLLVLVQDSDGYLFWYRILMVTCLVQNFDCVLFGTRF